MFVINRINMREETKKYLKLRKENKPLNKKFKKIADKYERVIKALAGY